jgi:hypothetical protein
MPEGNCWTACVASILDLRLEQLVYLQGAYRNAAVKWMRDDEWTWAGVFPHLHRLGFTLSWILLDDPRFPSARPQGYSIASGEGPQEIGHSCVALDGEIVHDPHPEGSGLVRIEQYELLVPIVRGPG